MEQLLFDNEENHDFVTDPELEKKTFGLLLLKTKEVHKVSQNALITMVDDVTDLIQDKIKTLEIDVMSTLASFGVGSVCCNELKKLFSTAQCTPELEKKTFGLLLLKTKEVHKVSQNALITMVDDVTDLIQDKIKTLEIDVMSTLASFGVGSVCCNELKKLFSTAQCTPFSSLNTKYLQEKYYREYLGLLVRIIVSHNILYAYFL